MKTTFPAEISRRHFLAQASVGLAAISTTSLAIAQGSAANSKIRLGVVGCGKRGQWIANLFAQHGGYEIVGVADYFEAAVKSAVEKLKLPAATPTFTGLQCAEKMIAHGGLDAIAIISPPYFHPPQAQAAVAAGLNVYLAKPVAVDVPGCHSISASGAAARSKGKVFLVDFQTRTNEFFTEAIRRVHAGTIGDLCFGEATYHDGRLAIKAPPGTPDARLQNWVFDQALSGDIIVEQNIHTLDVMSWIMKDTPPVRCTGTGGRRVRVDVGNAWDHFALVYEYANQVGVTFSSRQFDAGRNSEPDVRHQRCVDDGLRRRRTHPRRSGHLLPRWQDQRHLSGGRRRQHPRVSRADDEEGRHEPDGCAQCNEQPRRDHGSHGGLRRSYRHLAGTDGLEENRPGGSLRTESVNLSHRLYPDVS
jgi:myo-inositol 2-dehydrogenase/D-chiro-inositol 1-dehydrogenase